VCDGRAHLTFRPRAFVLITEVKLILNLYRRIISPPNTLINTFIQGFAHCTVQKQNLSLHTSLSREPSSSIPWLVILRRTSSVHLSLGLPDLRIPCSSHSTVLRGNLFSVIPHIQTLVIVFLQILLI